MAIFDVRKEDAECIERIVFSASESTKAGNEGTRIAYELKCGIFVYITDAGESVRIESKEHALNLIKALNKAIELGWLK